MTPETWQRVERIFHAAADLAPGSRTSFLDQECKGDPALRQEVESLLARDDGGQLPIETVIMAAAESMRLAQGDDAIGRRIGAYRVTRLIGEGGMAQVFLAIRDDDLYQKQVAIKRVRQALASDFMVARLKRERQILAGLEHPNIARLIDGGTTEDGSPYFVMEYVEGRPITHYCESNELSVRQRLELFRSVCAAVHYAHRNLVVHRDLKPTNILVTGEGVPKLLDFGISKLLSPDPSSGNVTVAQTTAAIRLMTPEYASPEQVRGEQVSTATDVYSLGVLLFELMTRRRPYRFKNRSIVEIERVVCHKEVERPSSVVAPQLVRLRKELAGDLDNIVLMALRKDPGRRYESVDQLSHDIGRHLAGQPVFARTDAISYRAGKFLLRHKLSVGAVVLIMLSLVGGMVATTYQARRAERRFQQVRRMANTFLFDVHDKLQNVPGSTEARQLVVSTALEYLDNLARESEGDPALQLELARAYERIGDVQGGLGTASLGRAAVALQSYRKALKIEESLAREGSTNLEVLQSLTTSYYKIGSLLMTTGDLVEAIESFRRGLNVIETAIESEPDNTENQYLRAEGYTHVGQGQAVAGESELALENYQTALKVTERLAERYPGERVQTYQASVHERMGNTLSQQGQLSAALDSFRRALQTREELSRAHPNDFTHRRNLMASYQDMGDVLGSPVSFSLGRTEQALVYYRNATMIGEELAAADPKDARIRHSLAVVYTKLGNVIRDSDPSEALDTYRKAGDILEGLFASAPEELVVRRSHARNDLHMAYALRKLGENGAAMASLRRALDAQQAILERDPARRDIPQDMMETYNRIADLKLDTGDSRGALENYSSALTIGEILSVKNPLDPYTRRDLSDCYERIGRLHAKEASSPKLPLLEKISAWQAARASFQKSLDIWNEWTKWSVPSDYSARRHEYASRAVAECDAALARLDAKLEQ